MKTAGLIIILTAGAVFAQDDAATARQYLEQWMATQRMVSKEEQDWRVAKELLGERVGLIEREIVTLREQIAKTRAEMEEAADKIKELKDRNTYLKEGMSPVIDDLKGIELRTISILSWTPEPVRMRVAPLSHRIPANPAESRLSLSERYQNVIGTLNELNKAARELSISGEVRNLDDGRQFEATVFYVGLSQAYYVNDKMGLAGIGKLGPLGSWAWEERNELVEQVSQVIRVYRNEMPAAYVPLPAEVR